MPKPKALKNLKTIPDISRETGKSKSTIRYYKKKGILSPPAITLTVVRYIGIYVRPYIIYLWKKRQVTNLKKNILKLSRGKYKKNKHPIKGVKK
jgi:hypothetical protein